MGLDNMRLSITPLKNTPRCTIGALRVNGTFECYTLQDAVREKAGVPVAEWKIKDKTAIPSGTYPVILNNSKRFKREMPLLVNVPGFDGVRIHSGNTDENTEGCILVGMDMGEERIGKSRIAFDLLFSKLLAAKLANEPIEIEVNNL